MGFDSKEPTLEVIDVFVQNECPGAPRVRRFHDPQRALNGWLLPAIAAERSPQVAAKALVLDHGGWRGGWRGNRRAKRDIIGPARVREAIAPGIELDFGFVEFR